VVPGQYISHATVRRTLIRALLLGLWGCALCGPGRAADTRTAGDSARAFLAMRDSVITSFSLEELERFRSHYAREITRLQNERLELRKRGIRDGELFLSRKPAGKSGDKVMMRLAELYYEQAQDDFQLEMQEYDRLYALYERGQQTTPPAEPQKNIGKALDLYVSVVEKYPHSDLVDDAFFNIGFLLEEAGFADSSRAFYEKVVNDFPRSTLMPDALMRLGEYYFNPPVNAVETAITYFERILPFYDSPRYNEALYRLGWCYYRINDYPRAISYFTRLADDIEKARQFDPQQKFTNPSLADESVEYIGLSFLDYGGANRAAEYLQKIGGRDYGVQVLKRIGDAYFNEKEDYPNALQAFTLLLTLYPNDALAPVVQNRIVQCYRRLEDQAQAFRSRELLYTTYGQGSDWWNRNTDAAVRKRALLQVESALRDNITVLLNRGQETGQIEFFQQAVLQSRKYLDGFAADSSAALIHWNMALTMDTKLKQTQQAFDEYLRISNLYWNSPYQRFAATNAVALARDAALEEIADAERAAQQTVSLADLQKETKNPQGVKFRERMKLEPHQLTTEEQRLAQAYDNYIKLFPHDPETPVFLANAGALYYHRHQYKEALKYFNTLLRHFPGSEEFAQARSAIMESYFGKADFRSAEIIARRIANSDVSEETKTRARRRLAESIYLAAEMLAEDNKHLEAGNEYRRVVTEAPNSTFADLALFNAALEFDKANEYNRAIETYGVLLTTQPKSAYVLDAQNNLAFDYVELRDYRNAALTYERLASIQTDTLKARDALYNAALYYARSEDWESAIKINRSFLQRFPTDEYADDAAFDIAIYYQRMNEQEKSLDALSAFIKKFPESPRTVEAAYLRGRHYHQLGQSGKALQEFLQAAGLSETLHRKGLDRNDFYAAESEFAIAAIQTEAFDAIAFRLPSADLAAAKEQKKELLLEIVRRLGNCAGYGTPRVYEATHLVGVAYQRFAEAWAAQELPEMESNRRIVAQKEINDAAVVLSERAAVVFRNAIKGLSRLKESYYQDLIKGLTDSAQVSATVSQDSLLRIADKWIDRSKERLTEVYYNMGEWRYQSALAVQNAPVPKGLNDLQRLVYQKQLLQIGAIPLLQQTLASHQANILSADSMGYDSPWVALSRQKLLAAHSAIPKGFSRLAIEGLATLSNQFINYSNVIYSGRSLEDQLDVLAAYAKDMSNMVDFSQAIMDSALAGFRQTLLTLPRWRVEETTTAAFQDSLLSRVVQFADRCELVAADAKERAALAGRRFSQTEDPIFEEALFTFDSNRSTLRHVEKEVLERGYGLSKEFAVNSLASKDVLTLLVAVDPENYATAMNLNVEEQLTVSDTTWRAASTSFAGWAGADFDASLWSRVAAADPLDRRAVWLLEPVSDPSDSLVVRLIPVPRMFLRKFFTVAGLPVRGWVSFPAAHAVGVYLNGELIRQTHGAEQGNKMMEVELTDGLVSGQNLLALEVVKGEGRPPSFQVELRVRQVAGWERSSAMHARQR